VLGQKTLKNNHVLFSSPKGAKHESLKARNKNIEIFVFLSFHNNFLFLIPVRPSWELRPFIPEFLS